MGRFAFSLRDPTGDRLSIESYRRRALRILPRMIATYVESVADDGSAFARNRAAFTELHCVPRAPSGVARPDISTCIGGVDLSLPVMLAPTGLAGFVRPEGEIHLARAAEAQGTRLILSMASSTPVEDVARATCEDHWFQLYPVGDEDSVGALLDRVEALGYGALVVTVDSAVVGKREAERSAGLDFPVRLTPARCLDIAMHPRWLLRHLRYRRGFPVNYPQFGVGGAPAPTRSMQLDLDWPDLAWLRDRWPRKFYVKGLLHPDDAFRAVEQIGADGVILSNHGGRQLGCAISAIDALPAVASRLDGRGEILVDGGIRCGSDVVKALCLGADAVLVGRPPLYGLGCEGEAGVRAILDILADEIRTTMILLGARSLPELGPDRIVRS
ncbi:MAG: alpha-hydroxy acid oxidase [Novosphingobium sp.]|nr:alpha-hydroxy acid oxidase [Novosphingobium sp.]